MLALGFGPVAVEGPDFLLSKILQLFGLAGLLPSPARRAAP
jgi:hypothetical protein